MRILAAALAAASLAVAGGCLGDGGTVSVTFDQQMGVSPTIGATFNSSNATATTTSDGLIHFTATGGNGALTMVILGPTLMPGQMVDMMADHNYVSYDLPNAGWSNNGGMVAVDGVNPYKLRFEGIPMLVGGKQAMGMFVINGTGTFK